MAGSDERAVELKEVLTEEVNDEPNELEKFLKNNFIEYINSFQKRLGDCARIEKLDSYDALREKIKEISEEPRKRFYIGYTNKLRDYLWTTTPKSKQWKNMIGVSELVKRMTYYIHRDNEQNEGDGDENDGGESDEGESDEGENDIYETDSDEENGDAKVDNPEGGGGVVHVANDETEAALILEFGQHNRCLNGNHHPGKMSKTGIIYVLKYEKISKQKKEK